MNTPKEKTLCDRCCAPAIWQAILRSGNVMSFCNHHKKEHAATLEAGGAILILLPADLVKADAGLTSQYGPQF